MATATGADVTDGRARLAKRGALAVALSLAVNWVVLAAVLATDLVAPIDALSYPPVTILTAAGALGATVVYALLVRYTARPDRNFVVVAAVTLVVSFLPDLAMLQFDPAATVPAVAVLMVMHVTVAAVCVAVLVGRRPA